jgi:hypothetical protein
MKKRHFPSSTLLVVAVYGLLLLALDGMITILTQPAQIMVDDTLPGWETK